MVSEGQYKTSERGQVSLENGPFPHSKRTVESMTTVRIVTFRKGIVDTVHVVGLLSNSNSCYVRRNRAERQSEALDANGSESGLRYRVLCVSGRMTSVCQATPKRLDGVLNTPKNCSWLRRHVLHEDELTSGPQNAPDLLESSVLIANRTQHRSRDHSIRGLIGQIEGLGPARTNIDIEAGGLGGASQVRMHMPIGFRADPMNVAAIVPEIRTCAGADLDNRPANATH